MNRKQKGNGCGEYVDPALEYRHCGNGLKKSFLAQNKQTTGKTSKLKGGSNHYHENGVQLLKSQYEVPSDITNTYLSEKTSELISHWANPKYTARGGNTKNLKKQKGAALDYPFKSEFNEYPIPNKVNFPIDEGIRSNILSNKDIFGCGQKGGSEKLNRQNGCSLGGSLKKKQKGAGFGYHLDVSQSITNKPEVVRYSTVGTGYYGKDTTSLYTVGGTKKMKGGSAASDSLMEYFLDFQHRCRNTEIY